jgi:DNA-binding protein Fis
VADAGCEVGMGNCAKCLAETDNVVVVVQDERVVRAYYYCARGCGTLPGATALKSANAVEPRGHSGSFGISLNEAWAAIEEANGRIGVAREMLGVRRRTLDRILKGSDDPRARVRAIKLRAVIEAVQVTDGDKTKAAKLMGISREGMRRILLSNRSINAPE